jgi:excinuclease UvrABC nuclease subunit
MTSDPQAHRRLSKRSRFEDMDWASVPAEPGVYVIYDLDEVVYVGMAGRNGRGSLRNRLRDHASGQIVNMFAQYLFLARVQFLPEERISHPREAKSACRSYIRERCSFQYLATGSGAHARELERRLKSELRPALNP